MKALMLVAFVSAMLCCANAYQIEQSREQLLSKYYSQVDQKVPKSARVLVGDERINAYIGHSVIGMETRRGELYSFEYAPLANPSIVIIVTDDAAERIENRSIGLLEAMDSGGITVKANNWVSAFKVEALKRAYAVSGIDARLTDKSVKEDEIYSTNSLFMQRARFSVWN